MIQLCLNSTKWLEISAIMREQPFSSLSLVQAAYQILELEYRFKVVHLMASSLLDTLVATHVIVQRIVRRRRWNAISESQSKCVVRSMMMEVMSVIMEIRVVAEGTPPTMMRRSLFQKVLAHNHLTDTDWETTILTVIQSWLLMKQGTKQITSDHSRFSEETQRQS